MAAPKLGAKPKKIPRFKSRQEEAEFWDTHSPLKYGDWKEVKLKVDRPLVHILGVRLDAPTIGKLGKIGRTKGFGASTLARMWLLERLEQEQATKTKGSSRVAARRTRR
jgi:hypothetical protein